MARTFGPTRFGVPGVIIGGVVALLVLVVIISWVRGCGQNSQPDERPTSASQQANVQPGPTGGQVPVTDVQQQQPQQQTVTNQSVQPVKPTPEVVKPQPGSVYQQYYDTGREAFDRGDYVQARNQLSQALKGIGNPYRMNAKVQLASIAKELTFNRQVVAGDTTVQLYHVERGDLPSTVAKKFGITAEFFMKVNNISDPRLMMAGKDYKVVKGPFNVVVHKKPFQMDVYLGDFFIKTYTIGLGRDNSTPIGTFLAGPKLINPEWYGAVDASGRRVRVPPDDPRNPLGGHWISLQQLPEDGGKQTDYGIHGTNEPQTIGQQASHGCIRMNNDDAAEVFNLLVQGKSRISILED